MRRADQSPAERSHGKHRTEVDGRRESQSTEIIFFDHGLLGLNGFSFFEHLNERNNRIYSS